MCSGSKELFFKSGNEGPVEDVVVVAASVDGEGAAVVVVLVVVSAAGIGS